jgi:hypothetical protein
MSLIMPIIEIIQLAAGAWLNPTNVGKIVQLILEKVIAIIIGLIATILQKLWDLLNLECLNEGLMDILAQTEEAFTGVMMIVGEVNSGVFSMSFWDNLARQISDPFKNIIDLYRETFSEEGLSDLLQQYKEDTMKGAAAAVSDYYTKGGGFKPGALISDVMPPELSKAVADVKQRINVYKTMVKSMSAMKGVAGEAIANLELEGVD